MIMTSLTRWQLVRQMVILQHVQSKLQAQVLVQHQGQLLSSNLIELEGAWCLLKMVTKFSIEPLQLIMIIREQSLLYEVSCKSITKAQLNHVLSLDFNSTLARASIAAQQQLLSYIQSNLSLITLIITSLDQAFASQRNFST